MKYLSLICFISFLGLSVSFPIGIQGRGLGLFSHDSTKAAKGSTSSSAAKASATTASGKTPSASSVTAAVSQFADDANTVSSCLTNLTTATDAKTIKSLASKGFAAESDEDAQRSVLAAAAGTAGTTPNGKIVKFTPTVLTGLQNIVDDPTPATAKSNLATIQNARNPNILPSITQLSNAALDAVNLPQTAQTFGPTG